MIYKFAMIRMMKCIFDDSVYFYVDFFRFFSNVSDISWFLALESRAGPQSQKWSDQQITVNPTGSIHEKAREKKFDPIEFIFIMETALEKNCPCSRPITV